MNSTLSPWNELPARLLRSVGVYRHGIASLRQVDDQALRQYTDWLSRGMHAGMDYLERYPDIRRDPRMLLDGATTVISCAFPYFTPISRTHGTADIALYALGTDYHEVVRNRLEQAAEAIRDTFGGQTRVCVDTAPLRERYWALHSGLGFIGTNNHLIIPGAGSYFFLGEILTTAPFHPTPPLPVTDCGRCGRCVRSCPTGAITPGGSVDARKCLSYLTIEHRGDFPEGTDLHGCLYGCDRCAQVCPHNAHPPHTDIPELMPRPELLALTPSDILAMDAAAFARTFRHSAIKRAKLSGMQRNAKAILHHKG